MASNGPAFNVYTVDDRDDDDDPFWLKIGAAFPHKDKKGFNIVLSALPTDARLVLREANSQKDEEEKPARRSRRRKR